jgi:hypothetical protein
VYDPKYLTDCDKTCAFRALPCKRLCVIHGGRSDSEVGISQSVLGHSLLTIVPPLPHTISHRSLMCATVLIREHIITPSEPTWGGPSSLSQHCRLYSKKGLQRNRHILCVMIAQAFFLIITHSFH